MSKLSADVRKTLDETLAGHIQGHVRSGLQNVMALILGHQDVKTAVLQAQASGVTLLQILQVLLPIVLSILGGSPVDFAAIIAAILALFNPPTPAP